MSSQVPALPGQVYAVNFPKANETGQLDLTTAPGVFTRCWYNPRTGDFEGEAAEIAGGGWIQFGPPLREPQHDWTLLVHAKSEAIGTTAAS